MINVFQPSIGPAELASIATTFESNWIGKGPKVTEFERAWAAHIGANPNQVVSVSCATEGLFQICDLILQPGDEVIIPSIHFIGAANAVIAAGGVPIFCDVDPATLNLTMFHIEQAASRKTKAIIILHYGGVAPDLNNISGWCQANGVALIEDAACAPATIYGGRAAGTWGDFGVWSFDAMKVLSTGDGGMIWCKNPEHARILSRRLYLGMDTATGLEAAGPRWWEFGLLKPGCRRAIMNDIAAAIGLEQLKRLPEFVKRRRLIARRYRYELAGISGLRVPPATDTTDTKLPYYFFWLQTDYRDNLAAYLREQGIYTTFRYHPLHRVLKSGFYDVRGAEWAADHTLLLPLHCGLTDEQVGYIIEKVKGFK